MKSHQMVRTDTNRLISPKQRDEQSLRKMPMHQEEIDKRLNELFRNGPKSKRSVYDFGRKKRSR